MLAALAVVWMLVSLPRPAIGNRTELLVGFFDFAPFVLDSAGKPSGMAVEILERAAKRASIRLRWLRLPPGSADAALKSGQIDLFPILTLTEERRRDFYASEPWWEQDASLISLDEQQLRPGRASWRGSRD